ncbi:MAG: isochorismatase family protein [Pseudomonadota bacterium]
MSPDPSTQTALDAIRRLYDAQHIRTVELGIGPRCAVLVIDFQHLYTRGRASTGLDAVERTAQLLATARGRNIPIVYTAVAYEPGESVLWTRKLPGLLDNQVGSQAVEIDSLVKPAAGDWVIHKKAASAFFGTGLSEWLRARDIDSLLVCGSSTSGCVRASVVDGMAHGFRMSVVRECVADRSALLHELALFDMGSKYGDLVSLQRAQAHLTSMEAMT